MLILENLYDAEFQNILKCYLQDKVHMCSLIPHQITA